MTVQLLSPDIKEFHPQKAIDLRISSGLRQRRPNYMDEDDKDIEDDDETLIVVSLASIQSDELMHDDEQ